MGWVHVHVPTTYHRSGVDLKFARAPVPVGRAPRTWPSGRHRAGLALRAACRHAPQSTATPQNAVDAPRTPTRTHVRPSRRPVRGPSVRSPCGPCRALRYRLRRVTPPPGTERLPSRPRFDGQLACLSRLPKISPAYLPCLSPLPIFPAEPRLDLGPCQKAVLDRCGPRAAVCRPFSTVWRFSAVASLVAALCSLQR